MGAIHQKDKIIVDGVACLFSNYIWTKRWNDSEQMNYCPICNEKFNVNDSVQMILCNHILFPNGFIHSDCIVDGRYETAVLLTSMYKDYIKYMEAHKAWRNK